MVSHVRCMCGNVCNGGGSVRFHSHWACKAGGRGAAEVAVGEMEGLVDSVQGAMAADIAVEGLVEGRVVAA